MLGKIPLHIPKEIQMIKSVIFLFTNTTILLATILFVQLNITNRLKEGGGALNNIYAIY